MPTKKAKPIKANNYYRLQFYHHKQYRIKYIHNEKLAQVAQKELNNLKDDIKNGNRKIPDNINVRDFILDYIEEKFPTLKKGNNYTKQNSKSFLELLNKYESFLACSEKALSTQLTEKVHIRHLKKYISKNNYGGLTVPNIPRYFFKNYLEQRSKKVKKCTVRKELRTFKYILNDVEDKPKNLFKELTIYKKDTAPKRYSHQEVLRLIKSGRYTKEQIKNFKRFRYLNIDELNEIIELVKGKEIFPIIMMAICTGMRRGELVDLRWPDVNFEDNTITVYSKKQSKQDDETSRTIPINKSLEDVLLEHRKTKENSCFVFTRSNDKPWMPSSLNKALQKVQAGTPFEGIGLHCFRHSMSSNLVREGKDQRIINEILGHTTDEMARRYLHIAPIQSSFVLNNYLMKGKKNA